MTNKIILKLKEKEKELKKKKEKENSMKRNKTVSNFRRTGKDIDKAGNNTSRGLKANKSMGHFLRKDKKDNNEDNKKKIDLKYISRTPKREEKSKTFYSKTEARTNIKKNNRLNERKSEKKIINISVKGKEDKNKKDKSIIKKEDKKEEKKIEPRSRSIKRHSKHSIKEKDKKDIKKTEKNKEDNKKTKNKEQIKKEDKKDKKDIKNKEEKKETKKEEKKEIKKDTKKEEKKDTKKEEKKEPKKEEKKVENKEEKKEEKKEELTKIEESNNNTKKEDKKEEGNTENKTEDKKEIKKEEEKPNEIVESKPIEKFEEVQKIEESKEVQSENKVEKQVDGPVINQNKIEVKEEKPETKKSKLQFKKIVDIYDKIHRFLYNEEKKNLLLISKESAKSILPIIKTINQNYLKEGEDALNKFKSEKKEEEYNGEAPPFQLNKTGMKVLEKLNEEANQKLFLSEEIPKKEIILIYRIFLQLINKNNEALSNDDVEFWKYAKDKIYTKSAGKLGENIKGLIQEINLTDDNLNIVSDICKDNMDKLSPKYYNNLCPTTALFFLLIKEILEYCGILFGKKTSLHYQYKRLESNVKKYKKKEEIINKMIEMANK